MILPVSTLFSSNFLPMFTLWKDTFCLVFATQICTAQERQEFSKVKRGRRRKRGPKGRGQGRRTANLTGEMIGNSTLCLFSDFLVALGWVGRDQGRDVENAVFC